MINLNHLAISLVSTVICIFYFNSIYVIYIHTTKFFQLMGKKQAFKTAQCTLFYIEAMLLMNPSATKPFNKRKQEQDTYTSDFLLYIVKNHVSENRAVTYSIIPLQRIASWEAKGYNYQ